MKVSDYIVEYLIKKGITDVFGYPGGMVTHLMDSFSKYKDKITAHLTYNEQGAAMAACGYAQISGRVGIAYATSGPGATNMITGICNAYMDSIPTLFITGQVNSFEQKGKLKVRQRGFQETDIVSMVKSCTKYAKKVNKAANIKRELDRAFEMAVAGRKGPVLLDIAMDVTKEEINVETLKGYESVSEGRTTFSPKDLELLKHLLQEAKRPVFLLGNGFTRNKEIAKEINSLGIPIVTSMISIDQRGYLHNYYGFIGAYGDRTANFIIAKSDLVIALGSRLDVRQVGGKREAFASNSVIVRIDIDPHELEYKVHEDEYAFCMDCSTAIDELIKLFKKVNRDYSRWFLICEQLKDRLREADVRDANRFVQSISRYIPDGAIITTDVGQNQVWVAQSFEVKENQRVLFSGGHGAMGYSLPAAIGAQLASSKKVFSFNGDGGIQMNIQELQVISREKLPIKVIIFNNNALGMIRHFQEMYFEGNYFQTVQGKGFSSPNFSKIAEAYGLKYQRISKLSDVDDIAGSLSTNAPELIEVCMNEDTYVYPKLEYGKPNQDQEPLLDRETYLELMLLDENKVVKILEGGK